MNDRQPATKHISKPIQSASAVAGLVYLLAGCLVLLLYPGFVSAQDGRRRSDRIEDHFSSQQFNRQKKGKRGRDKEATDPTLEKFRTIEGSHNNLKNTHWGTGGSLLWRKSQNAYGDGLNLPARLDAASPREISNAIFAQTESTPNSRGLTDMVWQWGQFLDHDLDLTESHMPLEPFPILVPAGDAWFDPESTGVELIFSFRSLYHPTTGIDSPRQQINEITAWIDGSNVYGSEEETAHELREFVNGLMKVSSHATGDLLPEDEEGFFLAGDVRANEQVYLTSMHTLFVREHNRIARQMKAANPNLNDEQLYQHARKRNIAIMQAITYNEFIPALMGERALSSYRGYDSREFPNITNEFSTAAFRFGHSMLNSELLRLDADMNVVPGGNLNLANAFFNPQHIQDYGIDPYLNGLMNQAAQEVDGKVIDDIRNFLFGMPGAGGFDLASLNIQRGRDHGLPSINHIRYAYKLPPIMTFSELTSDTEVQSALRSVYSGINKADPWVVMLCEDHVPGASVGSTVFAVLKDQFERSRDADRFWYEREFSGSYRETLRNTRLSNVIRRNTSLTNIREDVFRMPDQ